MGADKLTGSLFGTVQMVYFATRVTSDPFQLVLIWTVFQISVLLFEIPTGVIADIYSRRLSVILGFLATSLGSLAVVAFQTYSLVLLGMVILGVDDMHDCLWFSGRFLAGSGDLQLELFPTHCEQSPFQGLDQPECRVQCAGHGAFAGQPDHLSGANCWRPDSWPHRLGDVTASGSGLRWGDTSSSHSVASTIGSPDDGAVRIGERDTITLGLLDVDSCCATTCRAKPCG